MPCVTSPPPTQLPVLDHPNIPAYTDLSKDVTQGTNKLVNSTVRPYFIHDWTTIKVYKEITLRRRLLLGQLTRLITLGKLGVRLPTGSHSGKQLTQQTVGHTNKLYAPLTVSQLRSTSLACYVLRTYFCLTHLQPTHTVMYCAWMRNVACSWTQTQNKCAWKQSSQINIWTKQQQRKAKQDAEHNKHTSWLTQLTRHYYVCGNATDTMRWTCSKHDSNTKYCNTVECSDWWKRGAGRPQQRQGCELNTTAWGAKWRIWKCGR